MRRLPPGPLPNGWFWLEWWWPNGPSGAELIIPTHGDFADYEAGKCARKGERLTPARPPPALTFDQYMTDRIAVGFVQAARLAGGDDVELPYRVPALTATAFRLMSGEDADDTRRFHLAKTRLALDALVEQHPKPKRRRRLSLAAALKQADKAGKPVRGATIEDGKVELRFGEPDSTEPGDLWDRALGIKQ
jgi:hypothetical protein